MHIDKLFALTSEATVTSDNEWQMTHPGLPDSWGQGRTAFGGLTAGFLYHALSQVVDSDRSLRTFHINFAGPVSFDTPFQLVVEKLRSGRNLSQYLAKLQQDGKVCTSVQACFAVSRDSKINVNKFPSHSMKLPEKAKFIPQIPKITPRFFRHFELAIEQGQIPFSWSKHSHYHGWMRFKEPVSAFHYGHLISLIDAWPPATIQTLKLPVPVSTVSWDIEIMQPLQCSSSNPWFAYQVDTKFASGGYTHTEATIWDDNNRVIASSRQTVAIFD